MDKLIIFIIVILVILLVTFLLVSRKQDKKPPLAQAQFGGECTKDNYDFCRKWKENVQSAYRNCENGRFVDAVYPFDENGPQQTVCTVTCTSNEYFVDSFREKCRKPKVNYTGKYVFVSKLVEFPEPTAPQFIEIKILYEDEAGDKAFGLIIINNLTFTFTTKPYTDNDNYTYTLFFNNDTAFMKIKSLTDIELTTSYGIYKKE